MSNAEKMLLLAKNSDISQDDKLNGICPDLVGVIENFLLEKDEKTEEMIIYFVQHN